MMQIYYADGVNPSTCQHTCSTLKEAKKWINEQTKGRTMIDPYASCSEDVMESSKTAFFAVFDGDPVSFDENGEEVFHEPIYATPYFYTEE